MTDLELLGELRTIDTPTVTNVVATYPGRPLCLEIYNPLDENGAVKFPADRLEEVVRNAKALAAEEDERVGKLLKAQGLKQVKAIMAGHEYTSRS